MPSSNPSQEEMGDSDSGPKCLGKEGALSTFHHIRQRSVDKACTLASGQYLMTRSNRSSNASVLQGAERQHMGRRGLQRSHQPLLRHLPPLHLFLDTTLVYPP